MKRKRLNPTLTKLLVFITVLFIFNFPTYYAWKNTPPGKVFSGQAFWFDPWDVNVYVSAIRWSQKFGLNFQNQYTTIPHKPAIFYPLYTTIGVLFPKTNPFALYHGSLLIVSLLLLLTIYLISKKFLYSKKQALLATLLTTLGGGFGWLFYPKILLPDIAVTPITFYGTLQRPHEVFAMIFYFASLFFTFRAIDKKSQHYSKLSAISLSIALIFYPFLLINFFLISALFTLLNTPKKQRVSKKITRKLFAYLLPNIYISAPIGLLYSLHLLSSQGFRNVISQKLSTPNPISLFLGYGILLPTIIQLLIKKGNKTPRVKFLAIWFFTSIALSYLPFGFSKLFLRGLYFPAVLLSTESINSLSSKYRPYAKYIKTVVIIFLTFTTFLITLLRLQISFRGENKWFYIHQNTFEAIQFLQSYPAQNTEVITNSFTLSNQIPTFTLQRVYFGHEIQSPNSREALSNIDNFYNNKFSEIQAKNFLDSKNIRLIILDLSNTNSSKSKLEYSFLKIIYANPSTIIYSYNP